MKPLRILLFALLIVSLAIGFPGLSQDDDSTSSDFVSGVWIDALVERGDDSFLMSICDALGRIVDNDGKAPNDSNEPGELGSTINIIKSLRFLEKQGLITWNGAYNGHWDPTKENPGRKDYHKYCPQSPHSSVDD